MKLPKIINPKAAYFWGGVCIVIALALTVFGPVVAWILWAVGIATVIYGAALQFAPEELAQAKAAVKTAADAAKAATKSGP